MILLYILHSILYFFIVRGGGEGEVRKGEEIKKIKNELALNSGFRQRGNITLTVTIRDNKTCSICKNKIIIIK